jgi:hypothetical protein
MNIDMSNGPKMRPINPNNGTPTKTPNNVISG